MTTNEKAPTGEEPVRARTMTTAKAYHVTLAQRKPWPYWGASDRAVTNWRKLYLFTTIGRRDLIRKCQARIWNAQLFAANNRVGWRL